MTPLTSMKKIHGILTPLLVDGAADGTAAVLSLLEQMPILPYDMPEEDGKNAAPSSSSRGRLGRAIY